MNSPILGLRVASVIFALSGIAQMTRLLARAELHAGLHRLGLFASVTLLAATITLSLWLWRLASNPPAPRDAA